MESEFSPGLLAAANDQILVGRVVEGDAEAFSILVRRYYPIMKAYVVRLMGGTADVDDVLQESFITAWEQIEKLDDRNKVKSWLMRIVSRKAVDRLRSMKPYSDLENVQAAAAEHAAPPRQVEAKHGVEALGEALKQLPEQQRECWVLREIGGYSYEEISSELELSTSTVRGALARARKFLLTQMEQWR